MIAEGYRYQFAEGVRFRDAEDTLLLAILAAINHPTPKEITS